MPLPYHPLFLQVSESLAADLKWMGWNAAWHASNTMVGYMGDAANDLAGEKQHFDNIVGNGGELFNDFDIFLHQNGF